MNQEIAQRLALAESTTAGVVNVSMKLLDEVGQRLPLSQVRYMLKLDTDIRCMIADDENPGSFKEGMTDEVYLSFYDAKTMCRNNKDTCDFADMFTPINIKSILKDSKVLIMTENVKKDDVYRGVFSTKDYTVKNDSIFNTVVDFEIIEATEAEKRMKQAEDDLWKF